ncbi:MAG: heavy metal translocating P-type ATPase [Gemmatimonadaceae bacterium]|nr:heavy metal translocating P-type ATPase [Gemmatimonadaceae bacterium]
MLTTHAEARASREVACTHCGLVVAAGEVRPAATEQFCCAGCRTAWEILHTHGLDRYYDLPERRAIAVAATTRSYDEFDHPAFHQLHVRAITGGLARVTLVLEGVHCASCVWLVERVPVALPGLVRAELDARRSIVTIEWDATAVRLSAVARTLASLGYPPHPHHGNAREEVRRREDRAALVRIGVAGAIAINVMLAALAMYAGWFGSGLEREFEQFFRWLSLLLVIPAIVGPGRVFFRGAWAAVRTRTLHLDLPIAIALAVGFARGVANTVTDRGPIYLDGIALLIFLLLVGRFLQQRWQRAATDASELLHSLTPNGCLIEDANGTVQEAPAAALLPGMVMVVRAGDTLAADGVVDDGTSAVNVAWLTGESRPVSVGPGDAVHAGTLNVSAPLRVRVTSAGEATRVARLLRQVEESAQRRAPVVLLANRLSGWFVATVLLLGVVTWAVWLPRDPDAALDHAIALLIVTCPCALAMATPLSVTVALGRAARLGIFVRGGDALQELAGHGTIVLDKTGTITEGASALVAWHGDDDVRPLVLALEAGSLHPVAEGFRQAWPKLAVPSIDATTHMLGNGIRGRVAARDVVVGSPSFVRSQMTGASPLEAALPIDLTPVWIAVDGRLAAVAGFGDPVRRDSAAAIRALAERGWTSVMLSGDAAAVCAHVADRVGIASTAVTSQATPEAKQAHVERLRRDGDRSTVVMIGDGVNDAAAIATASVGIAVHGGAEAALATADAWLARPGLGPIVELVDGARRTMRIVRRNIAFSLAYNAVGVGLAMTGTISPVVAAVMMPLSSLTVVAGAWYGRSFPQRPVRTDATPRERRFAV